MNGYRVELARSARKELERLPPRIVERAIETIRGLRDKPRPYGSVKLKGAKAGYRIRIGRYRVVYEIDDEQRLVLISHILHRKDAYE